MKISIITVVFNNEKTILDSILSVQNQTYKNIEHIIIDGGSTDDTLSIIKNNIKNNCILISEKDYGIYDAMNKGIKIATGEIVGILNSDDIYNDETIIEYIVNKFQESIELQIFYGDLVYVKSNDISKTIRYWKSNKISKSYFENGNVPAHPTLFIRSDVYSKVDLFNLKFRLAADYEFILRIFNNYDFKSLYVPKIIVRMRLGGITNNNYFNIFKQNIEIIKAWKHNNLKIPPFFILRRFYIKVKQFF